MSSTKKTGNNFFPPATVSRSKAKEIMGHVLLAPLFSVSPLDSDKVNDTLLRVFDRVETADARAPAAPVMQAVMQEVLRGLSFATDTMADDEAHRFDGICRAGIKIAQGIDERSAKSHSRPSYHNRLHYAHVVLCGLMIGRANQALARNCHDLHIPVLSISDMALDAVIHASHDVGHNGGSNDIEGRYTPMYLETISWNEAQPILDECGVTKDDQNIVKAAILGSDPMLPSQIVKTAYRRHFGLGNDRISAMEARGILYPEIGKFNTSEKDELTWLLEFLLSNPKATFHAAKMGAADLFPSFGLGTEHSIRQSRRLNPEFVRQGKPPLVDVTGRPVPGAQMFALLSIVGATQDRQTGGWRTNFITPGASLIGNPSAMAIQMSAEKAMGPDGVGKLVNFLGLRSRQHDHHAPRLS